MLKEVFSARFEPVAQAQNALKMGRCGPKMGQKWDKNVFFQNRSWTIWDAQSVFSPC